jgi:hypothetical protein
MRAGAQQPLRKALALAALAIVGVLAVATVREVSIGRAEVAAADHATEELDWARAIVHARAAAQAYVPGSPWPERGVVRLGAIARAAEARADRNTALLAYGAIRTAALSTQAIGWSASRWRLAGEDGLARVANAATNVPTASEASATIRDALQRDEMPSTWSLAAAAASVVAMLAGLACLAATDRPDRDTRVAGAVALAGLVGYAAVLWLN